MLIQIFYTLYKKFGRSVAMFQNGRYDLALYLPSSRTNSTFLEDLS